MIVAEEKWKGCAVIYILPFWDVIILFVGAFDLSLLSSFKNFLPVRCYFISTTAFLSLYFPVVFVA